MSGPRDGGTLRLDGLLLANKGPGVTSFQVVAHLRTVLRSSRVGHGGTLDPMATGVLPVLLGEATKLTPYLQAQDKEYVATLHLGVTTDTLDATGRITAERAVPLLEVREIHAALEPFVGEIEQVPPMFSAVHVGGRRLHELARAGIEVARIPRRVRIDVIELLGWIPPRLQLRVVCGTGTYVRSLAADVGSSLGCGAHLEALQRTRLGHFSLAEAVPWSTISAGDADSLRSRILPPDCAVAQLPAVRVDGAAARRLLHGQRLGLEELVAPGFDGPPGRCRLYVGDVFVGVGEATAAELRVLRLLNADHPRTRPVSC